MRDAPDAYSSRMTWLDAFPLPNLKSTTRSMPTCRTSSRRCVRMCFLSFMLKPDGISDFSCVNLSAFDGQGSSSIEALKGGGWSSDF